MPSGRKLWLVVAICAAFAVACFFGIERYRYRFVRSDTDLLAFLPQNDSTVFFVNVGALRESGYLGLIEGAKPNQDREYTQFVRQTGFDYAKDIDTVAGSAAEEQFLFVLRGRFRWSSLRSYVASHGGACHGDLCETPTSTPGREASFRAIQPDVMGLAISADSSAASAIQPHSNQLLPSPAPVWVRPSQALLKNPAPLPLTLRIFAISLESADSVILALNSSNQSGAAFEIAVDAAFRNASTAESAKTQLAMNTRLLKVEIAKEHKQPEPADLAWLLTSGTFDVSGRQLFGSWPVRKELLGSLK